MVSDEEVEPPDDSIPNPQDIMADVLSDPPCIDSAPTEHSEPQAEQAHGRQRATKTGRISSLYGLELCLVNSFYPPIQCITAGYSSYFHSAP